MTFVKFIKNHKILISIVALILMAGLVVLTLYLLGIFNKHKKHHHIIPGLPILSHKCVYPDDPTPRIACARDTCYSDDDCTKGKCDLVDCT